MLSEIETTILSIRSAKLFSNFPTSIFFLFKISCRRLKDFMDIKSDGTLLFQLCCKKCRPFLRHLSLQLFNLACPVKSCLLLLSGVNNVPDFPIYLFYSPPPIRHSFRFRFQSSFPFLPAILLISLSKSEM